MDVLNRLSREWNELKEIVIYGFGRVAQRNIEKLIQDFKVKYIVDNHQEFYKEKKYKEIPIVKFEEIKDEIAKNKVIVTTSAFAYASIKMDLESIGLVEYVDYCRLEDFLPEWYWKNRKEVCLSQVFSSITSRCTFNCKYCNMLMPYYKQHYDYTAEDILQDMELLFKRVDYLTSYFVIGGEPLLNKNLPDILEKVYDKFGEKIGYIQVITNGSIVPSERLLEVIHKCNIKVRVSDYTHVLPYQKKLKQVIDVLKKNKVDYSMSVYKQWMDLGFPEKVPPIGKTPEEARQHMLLCSQGCHNLNDKKFYFCGLVFSAEKCGFYKLKETDYIDLQKNSDNTLEDKEEIMKYCLGCVKNKYISICNICRGAGSDNDRVVGVAEQIKRK